MDDKRVIDITEDFNKREKRIKRENKRKELIEWAKEHKGAVLTGTVAAFGLVKTVSKTVMKAYGMHMEHRNKDLRCYDASLGHYYELSRKLSNRDWLEIDRRKARGDRLGDILEDLRALR